MQWLEASRFLHFRHLNVVQSKVRAIGPQPPWNADPEVVPTGQRRDGGGKLIRNLLLLSLSNSEFEWLRPSLSFEHFPHHAHLYEPGDELECVHFPNRGLISLLAVTKKGKTVEVAMVGHEGVVGTSALIGLTRFPFRAVVQIGGDGFRINIGSLRQAVSRGSKLLGALSRYAIVQGMQAAQSAACNRLHGIEQRLARWLLTMQDRADYGSLLITHDFLAAVLGTDRPSVSLAAGDLQRKGAIEYTRGAIRIANRPLLQERTCECYEVIQQFNAHLEVGRSVDE
jgi:CRP-like cAMP-binding protein